MATITSNSTGGYWDLGSTWIGGVAPSSTDDAVVNTSAGNAVTIRNATTVGSGAGDAVWVNSATSKLIVNANLTVNGHLRLSGGGATVELASVGSAITLTLKNSATVVAKWYNSASNNNVWTITGTANARVNIVTDTSAGGTAGFCDLGSFATTINFAYATFQGLGTSSQDAWTNLVANNTTWSNVRWITHGRIRNTLTSGTAIYSFSDCVFMLPLPTNQSVQFSGNVTKTGGTRELTNCWFYMNSASLAKYTDWPCRSLTVTGGGMWQGSVYTNSASSLNSTYTNFALMCSPTSDSVTRWQNYAPNGNTWTECMNLMHSQHASVNSYAYNETAGGAGAANTYQDCIFDGAGSNGSGDCLLNKGNGPTVVRRNLYVNKSGNLCDGFGGGVSTPLMTITKNTCVDTCSSLSSGAISIAEQSPARTQIIALVRDNLFSSDQQGICLGGMDGFPNDWTPQTDWTVCNYNGFYNMTAPLCLWHPVANQRSYMLRPGSSGALCLRTLTSGTCTSGTNATTVVASGAAFITNGVKAGDMVRATSGGGSGAGAANMAVVNSVDSETQLTLGYACSGASGIVGLTTASVIEVGKGYWSAGQKLGDANYGANDVYGDPLFVDSTRTSLTWDTSLGGAGTISNLLEKTWQAATGLDSSGNVVSPNTAYSIAALKAYLRAGFAPTNAIYKSAASDGGDIGAVSVVLGGDAKLSASLSLSL